MTPRLNHVKSLHILAVVEMPTTLSLKRIATMSAEMVRFIWFWGFLVPCFYLFLICCQSQAFKAIHIIVSNIHSVLLLTLASYRGMLFAFWTLMFLRTGKIERQC